MFKNLLIKSNSYTVNIYYLTQLFQQGKLYGQLVLIQFILEQKTSFPL